MASLLESGDILEALTELARRLNLGGVEAGVRVVGGAALAIEYFERPATRDVDAFLHPADDVKAVAAEIGRERGWPADWLNDKALMFQSHHDSERDWKVLIIEGGVTIRVASPQLLLAMKLLAGRGRRDGDDIEELLAVCGVEDMATAVAIFDRFYPQEVMSDNGRARVKAWLEGRPNAES